MSDTVSEPISVDLKAVDYLISEVIPQWLTGDLTGHLNITLNMIHACDSEEQLRMMLIFPEETMAYSLYSVRRNARFLALVSQGQVSEIDRMMAELNRIRQQRQEDEEPDDDEPEEQPQAAVH